MASLNHVCMWSDHGWICVTAEEAARKHPGGTVSAHSGLFMCELCGQYVILTDGYVRERYFKHSAAEANKNCPERTFGSLYAPIYSAGEHELPIRLVANVSGFRLELGLIYVPEYILNKQISQTVTIKADNSKNYVYSFERLNKDSITYLPIGNEPSSQYTIESSKDLISYWPQKVKGILYTGGIFDGRTGKLLPLDADVQVNKKYYLLTASSSYGYSYRSRTGIRITKLCSQSIGGRNWQVFEVEATELNEEAAKFFLNLHCRLTDSPMELRPLWPVHTEMPYVLKHSQKVMYLHVSGERDVIPKSFPHAEISKRECTDGSQVLSVSCNERQQLISAGSANVLQYLYLWREALTATTDTISVDVRNEHGDLLEPGNYDELPEGKMLVIQTPFDGFALKKKKGTVIEKIPIPSGKRIVVDRITYGIAIQITVGLDVVWETQYNRAPKRKQKDDEILFRKLCEFSGERILVSHSFGALAVRFENYPMTRKWIMNVTRQGWASEKAINYLKRYAVNIINSRKGTK